MKTELSMVLPASSNCSRVWWKPNPDDEADEWKYEYTMASCAKLQSTASWTNEVFIIFSTLKNCTVITVFYLSYFITHCMKEVHMFNILFKHYPRAVSADGKLWRHLF